MLSNRYVALGGIIALALAPVAHGLTINLTYTSNVTSRGDAASVMSATAYAAQQYGASTRGLKEGKNFQHWTLDDLKAELANGHPVLLLVRYWDMPDHLESTYGGDHYVVALGVDGRGFVVYHDPASHGSGAYRVVSPERLLLAWNDIAVGPEYARTAMALYR